MPMLPVPDNILKEFETVLEKKGIAKELRSDFKKWLRYFLDFSAKYPPPEARAEQVRLFIDKLREKRQTPAQQKQAAHAASLYFEMQRKRTTDAPATTSPVISASQPPEDKPSSSPSPIPSKTTSSAGAALRARWLLWEEGYVTKSDSAEWDKTVAALASEIKTRHYSRKTLKTYAHWSRQFQKFLRSKPPEELSETDVKAYLTYLAVTCKVSASTQNQAFNALLFLYRHILKRDFGDHTDVPRATAISRSATISVRK